MSLSETADPVLSVERVTELSQDDFAQLYEATAAAILDGGGFGWATPPGAQAVERYFAGVMLVPERDLFVGRMDGAIVGCVQLVRPSRNNELQAFSATLAHAYVAPYARNKGLARMMTLAVEDAARAAGHHVLNLEVRETQTGAIALYESMGYVRWGEHPAYARVRGKTIRGYYYYKQLRPVRS
jgi:ribosomal protein S18 acetylase RimI-like enzyme